jgi:UDP-N-acetylglucosamine/UDP-N-acetylgalactosamine diphosphorylase
MIRARNENEKKIITAIKRSAQEHLLRFWDDLTDEERNVLMEDLAKVNFDWVRRAFPLLGKKDHGRRVVQKPEVIAVPSDSGKRSEQAEAFKAGESLIREGKTAVFTAAGGQSSRLGLDTPKGTYPVSPVRQKSLFQIHAEKIAHIQHLYDVRIPWLIMVSETNHAQTRLFFEQHDYFGLDAASVRFIEQGMFPAMDGNGKLLLKEKNRVFLNPTGHGGTFGTLAETGSLKWLQELGIDEIFYFQVDNVLVNVLDPAFLGYHTVRGCEMSSKCVMKRDMGEKIGVFVIEDGTPTVVEYSELSSIDLSDGSLVDELAAGNIATHIIQVDFAKHITSGGLKLPLHVAHKAVPHIDVEGKEVKPQEPNAYKFETFIFDALKQVTNTVIMETRRHEEFSPLKNKTGEDSPETVYRDQLRFFAEWFEEAGITVPRNEKGEPLHALEVSPRFAVFKGEFLLKIDKGMRIEGDTYIA